ncbi:MAG: nucleotidyltransferase family protein, partial [Oscillospiraceae bacterium]
MSVAGIIAEYNPFHNGHLFQIEQLHALGYDTVVCVMSPS